MVLGNRCRETGVRKQVSGFLLETVIGKQVSGNAGNQLIGNKDDLDMLDKYPNNLSGNRCLDSIITEY